MNWKQFREMMKSADWQPIGSGAHTIFIYARTAAKFHPFTFKYGQGEQWKAFADAKQTPTPF